MPKKLARLLLSPAGGVAKADVLDRWRALPKGKTITVEAVPYGSKGSSYERDSIRVCGRLPFLDAVLSNLKGLLRYEDTKTLLDVALTEQTEKGSTERVKGRFVLYLKVKEKARTTRARGALAPVPMRVAVAGTQPAAPLPAQYPAHQDALQALAKLGFKASESERRLAVVLARYGMDIEVADCIKYALNA